MEKYFTCLGNNFHTNKMCAQKSPLSSARNCLVMPLIWWCELRKSHERCLYQVGGRGKSSGHYVPEVSLLAQIIDTKEAPKLLDNWLSLQSASHSAYSRDEFQHATWSHFTLFCYTFHNPGNKKNPKIKKLKVNFQETENFMFKRLCNSTEMCFVAL